MTTQRKIPFFSAVSLRLNEAIFNVSIRLELDVYIVQQSPLQFDQNFFDLSSPLSHPQ